MIHESMMPSNFTSSGGNDYQNGTWNNPFWAIIIFVIFVVIIALFWRRDDHKKDNYGMEAILPAMMLQNNQKKDSHCCHERDSLKEFGDIKREIAMVGWQNDKSVLENRTALALGFKDNEVLSLKSTGEIMLRIDNLEKSFKNDEIRRLESKVNHLETVASIRGWGLIPAHAYAQYPMHNPCAPVPHCA